MIAALILFSIAATNLIWCIITAVATKDEAWLFSLILSGVLSIIGVATILEAPTDTDVKNGKAHYVEQNHIEVVNGDTINNYKTYEIVWIKNSN
jgi:hypothetical protein